MIVPIYGPKKNESFIFYLTLLTSGDDDTPVANPTLAAGDVRITTDGGTEANLGTLPVVTPAAGRGVKVTVSASEMNGDCVLIMFEDATGTEEWQAVTVVIMTQAIDMDDVNTSGVSVASGGIVAASIATDAITAAKIAADAIGSSELATTAVAEIADAVWDELQSGHTTSGTFGEIATEIASILTDTDALEGRLTTARAALIDNCDVAASTLSTPSTPQEIDFATPIPGSPTAGTVGDAFKVIDDNIDAAMSSRAPSSDWTSARAAKLDNCDELISSRSAPATEQAIKMSQTISESPTALTVEAALYDMIGWVQHKITVASGVETIFKSDGTTAYSTRNATTTTLIP